MRKLAIHVSVLFGLLAACGGETEESGDPPSTLCGVSETPCQNGSSPEPSPGWPSKTGDTKKPAEPPIAAAVGCDPGHKEVASFDLCEEDDVCYERKLGDGRKIVCTGAKGLCDDADCPAYSTSVKACPIGGSCFEHQVCDTTLLCEKQDAECDGYPDCDEGDKQVKTAEACALEKNRCYALSGCGKRTFCIRAEAEQPDP